MTTGFGNRYSCSSNLSRGRDCTVDPFWHPAVTLHMAFYDTRACTTCGVMGVTRHTCPFCPCNFCKKPGHAAPNCKEASKSQERSRRVGSSADRNSAASGPFSSPFSTETRRKQPRLTRGQITGLIAGSSVVAATSAGEGRSSVTGSDSQRPYAKRKMAPESENARKKSATSSACNRESNSDNVNQSRLKECDEELGGDHVKLEDEPACMMETSVDSTDELKIEITEDFDMTNSQRQRDPSPVAGKKALPRPRNVIDGDQQPEETESAQLKIVGDAGADKLNQRLEKYHEIVCYQLEAKGGTLQCPELACTGNCVSIDELAEHLIAKSKANGSRVLCPPENKSRADPVHVKSHLPTTLACCLKDAEPSCLYITHDPALLQIHENFHQSITKFARRKSKCLTCGDELPFPWALKKHEETHQYERKKYKCIDCGEELLSSQGLDIHQCSSCPVLLGKGKQTELYKCPICLREFKHKSTMNTQHRTHAAKHDSFDC
jgi:DNA-directed RNA polymerase subunit RPC12/RpoP